ncbi:MAG: hypothetical protein J6W40_00480 [Alphaproteobacteria bacterium]|nr:hypothetical protein [Alphaproteobacteria bacterium]
MKNIIKCGVLLTGVYEYIVIKSLINLNTCQLPFSAGYFALIKHIGNPFYWENRFCIGVRASFLQTLILCIIIPLFLWLALVSIRSIKHFLSFWVVYELVVILSIYHVDSCLIPFGDFPKCYTTPTMTQYILLCIAVPLIYLLLMVWKKR